MDLDPPGVFKPEEWIKKGRKYRGSPIYVIEAAKEAKAIPTDMLELLPKCDMPITSFIKQKLPKQSMGFNSYPTSTWFSSHLLAAMSNREVFDLVWKQRNIPPSYLLLKSMNRVSQ